MIQVISRSYWYVAAVALLVLAGLALGGTAGCGKRAYAADGQLQSDYCYVSPIVITRVAAGPSTAHDAVRVPFNMSGIIGALQMDGQGWDLHPTSASFVETDLLAQTITSTTAPLWLHIPSVLALNQTFTVNLYFGAEDVQRDQGMLFGPGDSLTRAHAASFNVANGLVVSAIVEILAQGGGNVADHFVPNTGWRLSRLSNATPSFRGWIDAATCDVTYGTATDGDLYVEMTFIAPNLQMLIYDNDTAALLASNTCNTGLGAISAVTTPFAMSGSTGAFIVRDVTVLNIVTPVLRYGFAPLGMFESVSVNPFSGTVVDESGNGLTGTYTFNRPQTFTWGYSVGSVQQVSALAPPAPATPQTNILGSDQFGVDPDGVFEGPGATDLFSQTFRPVANAFTGPRQLFWSALLVGFALVLLMGVFRLFNYIPLAIIAAGIPLVYGVTENYLAGWVLIIWALLAITSWFAVRRGESSA